MRLRSLLRSTELHGKCHRYDGYIRVKKLASWGKKFILFCKFEVPKMLRFTRFSQGKIWFADIGPCKRFDIFQLCTSREDVCIHIYPRRSL